MNSTIGLKQIKEIKGINIHLHWSVIILFLIPLIDYKNYLSGLIFESSIISIIVIHEFGHAIFAYKLKYKVTDIIIHALGGKCIFEEPEYKRDALLIYSGGVILQAASTIILLLIMSIDVIGLLAQKLKYFNDFYIPFITLNVLFIVINLLPIKSLDGYVIWKLLFQSKNQIKQTPTRQKKRPISDEEIKKDVERIMNHINNIGKRNK